MARELERRRRGIERCTDLPVAIAVRAVSAILARCGPRPAYRLASGAARIWRLMDRPRWGIVRRNLEIAFADERTAAERERIALECYRHVVATAIDVALCQKHVTLENWPRIIEIDPEAREAFERARPRGLAVLTAHLGDWELIHYLAALRGLRPASVARRIHNPHLDRFASRIRSERGAEVIPREGALLGLLRVFRRGGTAGLVMDQSAHASEGYLTFLGARGATHSSFARLLARCEPDVFFLACLREGFEFRFRIVGRDLTHLVRGPGGEEARAARLLDGYLSTLEEWIRSRPEQYLWHHRRWKHRPPGCADLYQRPGDSLDLALLREEREAAARERQAAREAFGAPAPVEPAV